MRIIGVEDRWASSICLLQERTMTSAAQVFTDLQDVSEDNLSLTLNCFKRAAKAAEPGVHRGSCWTHRRSYWRSPLQTAPMWQMHADLHRAESPPLTNTDVWSPGHSAPHLTFVDVKKIRVCWTLLGRIQRRERLKLLRSRLKQETRKQTFCLMWSCSVTSAEFWFYRVPHEAVSIISEQRINCNHWSFSGMSELWQVWDEGHRTRKSLSRILIIFADDAVLSCPHSALILRSLVRMEEVGRRIKE